jgi:hypothetical protein
MITREQLLIEHLAFACYQFQLEIKKAIDTLLTESILHPSNQKINSKEDYL